MKRAAISLAISLAALALLAAPASAEFGLKDLDLTFVDDEGEVLNQAGVHPFALKVSVGVNTVFDEGLGQQIPDEEVKDQTTTLLAGLAGNPTATRRCSSLDFLTREGGVGETLCSNGTAVGVIKLTISDPGFTEETALYNLEPPPGAVARLGFWGLNQVPVTFELGVKPTPPYNIVSKVANVSQVLPFYAADLTIWGNPADPVHDTERGHCAGIGGTPCSANLAEKPFLTTPRACEGPLETLFEATSWEGSFFSESVSTHNGDEPPEPLGFIDCAKLIGFGPSVSARPTTDQVESPSGLDFALDIKDENLGNPTGRAQSDIKKAVVTLPEGVTLNPSIAEGLLTCSAAQYEEESIDSRVDKGCPEASKVGTVEVETPLLEDTLLKGQLFVAAQDDPATSAPGAENPFDSLIALYMVIRDPELGILVKLAGRVAPNPTTGQIETTFGEPGQELPQFPLSHVRFHLREGGRSPLISPPSCDTYTAKAIFTPWADPAHPFETEASFQITKGVGGGPCPPGGPLPFAPGLTAGSLSNTAGSYSPFHLRLTRRDGDQDMTKFSSVLPPGMIGKLAGVEKCSDAQIAAAQARKSGREELASPSCPANSQIGRVLGGAGVGSQLTYVPGRLYLAGPYNGDPLSVVAIVPAVAGPFDVGVIVVRVALALNPATAQVEADGSRSDPIPHILAGIPLKVRDVRVYADRPQFTLNPTNCDPFAVGAELWGGGSDVFSPADDSPVSLSERFQAADCARLGFKPRLAMRLEGGTRRGDHPAFRAVVTPRPGDANFAKAVVTLPTSAFLDQGHIRTICTRVQYAAKACPPGAIYGKAKAWTPLLDEPLEGPVYLRSSNHKLPDLVAALHGIVDIDVVGRIDSHKGGIRGNFESIPDAPVSRFILDMRGGNKGLIVNSRNLCARKSLATARLSGQNGRRYNFSPRLRPTGCGK